MRRLRRVMPALGAILTLAGLAASPAVAVAAGAPRTVEPADLTQARALAPVRDRVLPPAPMGARAAGARTETFVDPHGHRITLSTDEGDLDLSRYASILAGTLHGTELSDLRVEVVASEAIGSACGAEEALGCYQPENPARSPRGLMMIPAERPDLTHILVHEYGHHVDNQLINLGHLGPSCNFANDGSRNWFFAREVEDQILRRGVGCNPVQGYPFLLGELYAEDYVAANGIQDWVLPSANPPSESEKAALRGDFARPFVPRRRRVTRTIGANRSLQLRYTVRDWTVLTVAAVGSGAGDLDVAVYRAGRSRALDRSARRGSREQVEGAVAPGTYRVVVRSRGGSSRARLRVDLY